MGAPPLPARAARPAQMPHLARIAVGCAARPRRAPRRRRAPRPSSSRAFRAGVGPQPPLWAARHTVLNTPHACLRPPPKARHCSKTPFALLAPPGAAAPTPCARPRGRARLVSSPLPARASRDCVQAPVGFPPAPTQCVCRCAAPLITPAPVAACGSWQVACKMSTVWKRWQSALWGLGIERAMLVPTHPRQSVQERRPRSSRVSTEQGNLDHI